MSNVDAVMQDMKTSNDYVIDLLSPIMIDLLGGGQIISVENNKDKLARLLDMTAGFDYIYTYSGKMLYAIASRVQYNINYRTFTVREERESKAMTEHKKIQDAIDYGALYPYFRMQAYIDITNNKCMSLAIARTLDVVDMINKGRCSTNHTGADQNGQAAFYYVKWDDMKNNANYWIQEYSAES